MPNKGPSHDDADRDVALQTRLKHMRFPDAVHGREIHNFMGGRVIEHTTSTGTILAIKATGSVTAAEAEMAQFAATHGVLAPQVRGFYEVKTTRRLARVMVSDRVPGVPLDEVWWRFDEAGTRAITEQLRDILAQMRKNVRPFIGRLDRTPTLNVFDIETKTMGPFDDEDAFDAWFLERVPGGSLGRLKWRMFFLAERTKRRAMGKKSDERPFVLTHGDLCPRNIIVQGTTITGLVDWERSGFFPEWAEYVFAWLGCVGDESEQRWLGVLREVLPVDERRVELARLMRVMYINS